MLRTFAYLRVSTAGQTTKDQRREIAAAEIGAEPFTTQAETVSGSVAAIQPFRLPPPH